MKKVIDANYFQDPALEEYLRADVGNKVVITDYASMEMYKGNAIKNVYNSIKIVSRYPEQVIILKYTSSATRIGGSSNDPQECLGDQNQTREFSRFCYGVRLAAWGDRHLVAQVLRFGQLASNHLNTIPKNPTEFIQTMAEIGRAFGPEHLRILRKREPVPIELGEKIIGHILWTTAFLFRDHPDNPELPKGPLLRNTYLFRYVLSSFLMVLWWISDGGTTDIRTDKLRNDLVDMGYIAYATFFDGLLTKDKKMQEIHEETCFFLENVFSA